MRHRLAIWASKLKWKMSQALGYISCNIIHHLEILNNPDFTIDVWRFTYTLRELACSRTITSRVHTLPLMWNVMFHNEKFVNISKVTRLKVVVTQMQFKSGTNYDEQWYFTPYPLYLRFWWF
jgi:hypothetical protein